MRNPATGTIDGLDLPPHICGKLHAAGLGSIDTIRTALATGRLDDYKGIGPAIHERVLNALPQSTDPQNSDPTLACLAFGFDCHDPTASILFVG